MKRVTWVAALMLLTLSAGVNAYPLPKNFCYSGCSSQQEDLWSRFEAAQTFESTRAPSMYSGPCYHLTRMYSNSDAHYAGVLIDLDQDGKPNFSGIFSFFAPNRYQNWSLDEARANLDHSFEISVETSEGFIDTNPGGETMMYYWLRDEVSTGHLLMVATWGTSHQLFCELTPNVGEEYE